MVRLELWNGARGSHEKNVLLDLEKEIPELPIDARTWDLACELARKARAKGLTVPGTDILIAACARRHAVEIEHADAHFEGLAGL
jgi:predicted nucleic acid-binding protein